MPDGEFANLGLFPLGVVLLPGERMPLHIFEPRYRELIADCTLGARPFVLSLGTENGVARTGCTATPVALLRRFDDGRMNLLVEGGDPVEILEQTTGSELYVTARVHVLADVEEPGDEALAGEVRERFRRLSETVAGAALEPDVRHAVPLSYAIAGAIELDPMPKQRLLESRSETERLTLVSSLLDTALSGPDRQDVAAERAHTNGKVTME